MAPTAFDCGESNLAQLCSRCFSEINPTVVDSNSDTLSTLFPKLGDNHGLQYLGSRKRKCVFTSNEEASDDISGVRSVGQDEDISSASAHADKDVTTSLNDRVTADESINEISVPSVSFNHLFMLLKMKILELDLPKKAVESVFGLISSLENKNSAKKVPKSTRRHAQPGDEIECLLRGIGDHLSKNNRKQNIGKVLEEDRHPWGALRKKKSEEVRLGQDRPPAPKILMRVWDDRSQARIREGSEGFLSGSNYLPLHTQAQRKAAIEKHAYWGNRQKTAFISATTDIEDLASFMAPRMERRQKRNGLLSITKITLINGNADGMPILRMKEEMDFYRCRDPYESGHGDFKRIKTVEGLGAQGEEVSEELFRHAWYDAEHLFLFRIPTTQIVKTWLWKDVVQWLTDNGTGDIKRWYDEVLVPEYNRHEHKRLFGSDDSTHEPNCVCCGH